MRISVIQSRQSFGYDPLHPGDYDLAKCRALAQEGIDQGFAMMGKAAADGADLIVTIEAFNASVSVSDPRYDYAEVGEPLDGPLVERFRQFAQAHGTYVVAGLYTRQDGRARNSAILFGREGRIAGVYDKVHLPLGEDAAFAAGDRYPLFETEHGMVGLLICWDVQYPEAVRALALAGADLVACPTWGWENIYGLCRAYENGVTIAAAMGVPFGQPIWEFCDPSCIVDSLGRILAAGNRCDAQIVTADVDIRAEPDFQYGADSSCGYRSMRHVRMAQRRPDTYDVLTADAPPLMSRYAD